MSEGSNRSGTEEKNCDFLRLLENYIKKVARLYAIQQKAHKKSLNICYTHNTYLKKEQ